MKELIFITGNKHKLEEVQDILKDYKIIQENIDLPEIQELDAEKVMFEKMKVAEKKIKKPFFIEDTCFCVDAWNGLPGPLIKWFMETVKPPGIHKMLSAYENKKARGICTIGYKEPGKKAVFFTGEIPGQVVSEAGSERFYWDRIFIPEGQKRRFSEMTIEEKNKISHRTKAVLKFKQFLEKN